jgi:hypothetical protein
VSDSKELTVPERAAIALGTAEHEKNLIALSTKYADITAIKDAAGRAQCHGAYMELKNTRVAIQNAAKDAREDANQFSKAVIAEAERLTGITTPEETRLQALRDDWDEEVAREKAAKAAEEKARVDLIRTKIDEIKTLPAECVGRSSVEIQGAIDLLSDHEITLEEFMEFEGEADLAKSTSLAKLQDSLTAQRAHEAEQERIKQERAELERLRAEAAERERIAALARAEEERRARAIREAEEARIAAERAAHEAELRKQREAEEARLRAERERVAEEQRKEREAHEAQMAAERKAIAKQQAELAAARAEQERVAREAREAAEDEERRKQEEIEAAARAEAERIRAEQDAADAEQRRREAEQFLTNGPGDIEIVEVLADHYDVGPLVVLDWLAKFDAASFLTPTEKAA